MRPLEERLEAAIVIRDLERRELVKRGQALSRIDREPKYAVATRIQDRNGKSDQPFAVKQRIRIRRSPLWSSYLRQYDAWIEALREVEALELELLEERICSEMRLRQGRRLDQILLEMVLDEESSSV